MTSANAFYNPLQMAYIAANAPRFGTKPNIPASPYFGTTVSSNPNFKGNFQKDAFERQAH